ncbi:hypothetical protein ACIBG7_43260 [Nonomuraea sp. NPDC050328]|uniref:hypothetical protein n=1 Tax=Nonomuraea sp. NPDC050328 TaxID=3364361 RepID=UPI0037BDAF6A
MTNLLTRDQLFQVAADLPWQDVPIRKPPNGEVIGTMRLRGMTGEESTEWQDSSVQVKGKTRRQSKHTLAMLIVTCAINEDGSEVFDRRDVMKVSQMPGYVLQQLGEVALVLSGLGEDDEARELIEDFDETPDASFTSD